jgi:peptide deformylase
MMTVDPTQLRIVHYPHPTLRGKAKPVDPIDPTVREVARRMIDLMHEADGVGLAAPQVALPWRLFVTHGRDADPVDRVYINPTLKLQRGEMETLEEGCLSLPGIHVEVRRAGQAEICAIDIEGNEFVTPLSGFMARVVQHEFDHIEGVLVIDRMNTRDRLATRKTLKELEAAGSPV